MKYILHGEHFFVVRHATQILLGASLPAFYYKGAASESELIELVSIQEYNIVILGDFTRQSELMLAIRKIRVIAPQTHIVVFTSAPEILYGPHCLQAGVAGFISKQSPISQITKAIDLILLGKKYISESLRTHLLKFSVYHQLPANPMLAMSVRELIVIDMLCEGKWVKEIADKLDIKTSTVSTYKGRAFRKLDVENLLDMFCRVAVLKEPEALQ